MDETLKKSLPQKLQLRPTFHGKNPRRKGSVLTSFSKHWSEKESVMFINNFILNIQSQWKNLILINIFKFFEFMLFKQTVQ